MSKTQLLDVHGKVKFIHAVHMSQYDKWSVTIYPDNSSLEKIRELQADGLKNVLKKDEDNQYYISFHREPTKMMRGKLVAFTAPKVIDKAGQPMDGSLIGRQSDVTVRLEVYRNPPGGMYRYVAARWDSLRVNDLVPWEAGKELTAEDQVKHESLVKASEPDPW